jgi:NAD-dependent deacetylase
MKKKIAIFTGAGISAESGIETFRGSEDSLWNNHSVDDVATPSGWKKDPQLVTDFYNSRRMELATVEPNDAHRALSRLETRYDVDVITQNIDDLHERGGSTMVHHLHGEITKVRGSLYEHKTSPFDVVYDIGYTEVKIGDTCKETGTQLRPHVVWFGEYPDITAVNAGYKAIMECDILLIIGTSLQISYTLDMLNNVRQVDEPCVIYYIDPQPSHHLDAYNLPITYIEKNAVIGVTEMVDYLMNKQ